MFLLRYALHGPTDHSQNKDRKNGAKRRSLATSVDGRGKSSYVKLETCAEDEEEELRSSPMMGSRTDTEEETIDGSGDEESDYVMESLVKWLRVKS